MNLLPGLLTNYLNVTFALQEELDWLKKLWLYLNLKFTFGKIEVSVSSFIQGVIVFLIALLIARSLTSLADRYFTHRAPIDPGIRYTIGRLLRYLFITIGALLALNIAISIDLTSIAVVFTALSVGIGFGLQYIAADIVSGFILLFERPIRIGDRITIGEDEGDIQSINLRTTIVSTNDRIAIIVPNSKLVTQRLVNWSYGDPRARVSIPVSVDTDSDIELVTRTLEESARDIAHVLTDPPPSVQFLKFGDYSLDFRLLVWTNQPRRHVQIKSDINYRLAKLFRERSIKIPFPTQEFLLKGVDLPKSVEASLLDDAEDRLGSTHSRRALDADKH